MELFVHTQEGIAIAEIDDGALVAQLAAEVGYANATVWLQDQDDPCRSTDRLADVVAHRGHLHVAHCQKVAVTVRYGGEAKERDFPPGATIHAVFVWATGPEGFKLPADQRAKHGLGVCGTGTIADRNDHVGSLAHDCGLCLDLAPRHRFQG